MCVYDLLIIVCALDVCTLPPHHTLVCGWQWVQCCVVLHDLVADKRVIGTQNDAYR